MGQLDGKAVIVAGGACRSWAADRTELGRLHTGVANTRHRIDGLMACWSGELEPFSQVSARCRSRSNAAARSRDPSGTDIRAQG